MGRMSPNQVERTVERYCRNLTYKETILLYKVINSALILRNRDLHYKDKKLEECFETLKNIGIMAESDKFVAAAIANHVAMTLKRLADEKLNDPQSGMSASV